MQKCFAGSEQKVKSLNSESGWLFACCSVCAISVLSYCRLIFQTKFRFLISVVVLVSELTPRVSPAKLPLLLNELCMARICPGFFLVAIRI